MTVTTFRRGIAHDGAMLLVQRLPEIERDVAAPGTPRGRDAFDVGVGDAKRVAGTAHAEVRRKEGIMITEAPP